MGRDVAAGGLVAVVVACDERLGRPGAGAGVSVRSHCVADAGDESCKNFVPFVGDNHGVTESKFVETLAGRLAA